jgi:hypothetical protein
MTLEPIPRHVALAAAFAALAGSHAAAQTQPAPAPPPIRWGTAAPAPMPPAVSPKIYTAPKPEAPPPVQGPGPMRQPALPGAAGAAGAARGTSVLKLPLAGVQPLAGAALAQANQQLLASVPVESRSQAQPLPARGTAPGGPGFGSGYAQIAKPATVAPQVDPAVLTAGCQNKGRIGSATGNFTPEGLVMLRGCDLGFARGQVRMQGAFPGGYVALTVKLWRGDHVVAEVPAGVQGVLDQPVKLSLVMADQRITNEVPAQFMARRVSLPIPGELVRVLNCARPQPSECGLRNVNGQPVVWAHHTGTDSQQGTDSFGFVLGNHWQLDRIELANAVGGVKALQAAAGVDVQWQSRMGTLPDIFSASYELRAYATGPAGVPMVGTAN